MTTALNGALAREVIVIGGEYRYRQSELRQFLARQDEALNETNANLHRTT
ncbi:MAG: hypothetical protein ACR2GG_06505 [Gemmatimonadaceae bacterium]